MSRYYFHTEDGERFRDEEGVELRDLAAAQTEAIRHVADMLDGDAGEFWRHPYWKLSVADERGLILFCLELSGALAPAIRV